MPRFAGALSDVQVADVVNYVRTSWRDHAPANATPELVASLRANAPVGAAGTDAARAFDCPEVGSGAIPAALATAAQANFLAADQGAFLSRRVVEMVAQLRLQQPGISDSALTNTMNAAFCPAAANQADLSVAQKRALLGRLNVLVQEQVAARSPPPDTHVVASVPLAPELAQQLESEAAAQHVSPAAFIADLLAKRAGK